MNIAQLGVGGHGLVHLEAIAELERRGLARLRALYLSRSGVQLLSKVLSRSATRRKIFLQ